MMLNAQAADRRQLGIYYTPNEATRILCKWAIRSGDDFLLEPSFGACGFLAASRARLQELQSHDPARQLFGCDIDENAFIEHLWPMFGERDDLLKRFEIGDFLQITPDHFQRRRFDAVIGNPPYVSHQRMSEPQKRTIQSTFRDRTSVFVPDKRADLWVYFILHSLRFLQPGARMAWILPGSFLQADYAAPVRRAIESHFERSIAIQLGQKLFVSEGAQENTIVVLADGWREQAGNSRLGVEYAPTLKDLEALITAWDTRQTDGLSLHENAPFAFLPQESRRLMTEAATRFRVSNLGDFCIIRIGIVTGANHFFVLTKEQAHEHGIPEEHLRPIVSKFSIVPGLSLTTQDLDEAVEEGFNCLLVDTANVDVTEEGSVAKYLATFDAEKKRNNRTFGKRAIWHRPDDGNTPHAFLSYMHQNGPRLALNTAQTTSTNTVHRAYFRDHVTPVERKAVCIALGSVFAQLSAELEGRAYGSGVLKHEPSGAKRIQLLMPSHLDTDYTHRTFDEIDELLRAGEANAAQQTATRWAMSDIVGQRGVDANHFQEVLERALHETRQRRHHPSLPAPLSKS